MAKKNPQQENSEATFACNLRELEQIVAALERGEVELEKSLELYERGAQLLKACRNQLHQAEMRIEKMSLQGPDGVSLQPMADADDDDDDDADSGDEGRP
jgi:exodeoxyribonuclease VII small subunit